MPKNILCYGDSNTWGCTPGVLTRLPEDVRWTGVVSKILGPEYRIIEDGINGRSTIYDDPQNQCRNGLAGLGYSLYRAKPLDLAVVMLGTNDLNYTDPEGYRLGITVIGKRILGANAFYPGTSKVFPDGPKLLLVSPILLYPGAASYKASLRLAEMTEAAAKELGIPWFDAASVGEPSPLDLCHMDAESHKKLGEALAAEILKLT